MFLVLEIFFWIAFVWMAYVFLGYPLLMWTLARLFPSPIRKSSDYRPDVTFVMAVYNEERVIRRRLDNYLSLTYPRTKLRFMIGSDASTDRTDEIIREYIERDGTIELRRFDRSGKTKIVYTMAEEARSEIVIFCDADILLEPDGVQAMVDCFADPDVGGVVVRMVYEDQDLNAGSVGEKTYYGMEDSMRRYESLYHTTVGPTGQCFAVRRGSYTPLTDYRMSDDLNLVITIPLNGKRVWFEPAAIVQEVNKRTLWSEFRRRLRMGRQSMATFLRYEGTRWPWRSRVGFQIWSHKLFRNLAAVPALLFFAASILLWGAEAGTLYTVAGIASTVWAGLMLLGLIADRLKLDVPLIGYPLYFTLMIAALTTGSLRAIMAGGGLAMWSSPRLD